MKKIRKLGIRRQNQKRTVSMKHRKKSQNKKGGRASPQWLFILPLGMKP